jgi:hypothetical protein
VRLLSIEALHGSVAALALTGPTGSMSRAVNGLYVERGVLIRVYHTGLLCAVVNQIPYSWLTETSYVFGIKCVTIIIFVVCAVVYMNKRTRRR